MNIEVRVYKRFDTDLLALHDHGYSLAMMMRDALTAYADGAPFHLYLDELVDLDLNDKKNVRVRVQIDSGNRKVLELIKGIKRGYRSNFCKMVLRNAFFQQNLSCYMADKSFCHLHQANAAAWQKNAIPGLSPCAPYRVLTRQGFFELKPPTGDVYQAKKPPAPEKPPERRNAARALTDTADRKTAVSNEKEKELPPPRGSSRDEGGLMLAGNQELMNAFDRL